VKIYTKTGDDGTTGLFAGDRVQKDHPRICAYGTVDELNSVLGLAILELKKSPELAEILGRLQNELFVLGGDLATPVQTEYPVPRIENHHVEQIEHDIDNLETDLVPLKQLVLPGGSRLSAQLHLARTVCRRGEREMIRLQREEKVGELAMIYLNRLSDLLFVMARKANADEGIKDVPWIPVNRDEA